MYVIQNDIPKYEISYGFNLEVVKTISTFKNINEESLETPKLLGRFNIDDFYE